ncbi:MAG: hypothetical protein GXO32_03665 [Crenarchaeota archaeon]|nr:hypothetical protein [Thermoproteota archaeon]
MTSLEELRDALRRVEEHLHFARLVYRSLPYVFWAGFIPLIFVASSFTTSAVGRTLLGVCIGLGLSIWVLAEERVAYRVLEKLDVALGKAVHRPRLYIALQLLSWVAAIAIAFIFTSVLGLGSGAWLLIFVGSGASLLILVDLAIRKSFDKEMLLTAIIPLASLPLASFSHMPHQDFAVMIVSSSMALTGFLYIRRALRA